jgi:hypothetical protein
MRVPSVRVVLVGLAAAAAFVGGSLATRGGPVGGRGAESGGTARSATAVGAPASTASLPSLGSFAEQLARLPPVAPGELVGVLDVFADDCSPDQIDLGTFERVSTETETCAAPGAKYGTRGIDDSDTRFEVIDLDGRAVETVAVPSGWFFSGSTRDGIVFCNDAATRARLRRFLGTTRRLPSCPLGRTRDGRLLFASADHRSVVDERGHRFATMAGHLPRVTEIRPIGDGLLAVNTELYRNGRRIASYGKDVSILGASSDGSVALLRRNDSEALVVHHRGVPHALSKDLAQVTASGVVAPDGRRILLQREGQAAIVLDAATRRPLARLEIVAGDFVFDWRPAPASSTSAPTDAS